MEKIRNKIDIVKKPNRIKLFILDFKNILQSENNLDNPHIQDLIKEVCKNNWYEIIDKDIVIYAKDFIPKMYRLMYISPNWKLVEYNKITILPNSSKKAENLYAWKTKYNCIKKLNYTVDGGKQCYILNVPYNKKYPKSNEFNINLIYIWNWLFMEQCSNNILDTK